MFYVLEANEMPSMIHHSLNMLSVLSLPSSAYLPRFLSLRSPSEDYAESLFLNAAAPPNMLEGSGACVQNKQTTLLDNATQLLLQHVATWGDMV